MMTAFRILAALAVFTGSMAQAEDVSQRYGAVQDWAMFAEDGVCWTVTAQVYQQTQIYLSVTVFKGKRDAQVSVMAADRLPRSAGLSLRVGGQRYIMKSDGRSAWPPQSADTTVISRLKSGGGVNLEQNAMGSIPFSAGGFREAYAATLKKCGRTAEP